MNNRIGDMAGYVCLRYRKTILLLLVALTVLAGSQMPGVQFDNALEIWFLDDDPVLRSHRRLLDTFGSDYKLDARLMTRIEPIRPIHSHVKHDKGLVAAPVNQDISQTGMEHINALISRPVVRDGVGLRRAAHEAHACEERISRSHAVARPSRPRSAA